jgi:hypothetical protein
MPPQDLNPGDRVVDLAAVVRGVALLTGAVGAASVTWLVRHSRLASFTGFLICGAVGFVVGEILK